VLFSFSFQVPWYLAFGIAFVALAPFSPSVRFLVFFLTMLITWDFWPAALTSLQFQETGELIGRWEAQRESHYLLFHFSVLIALFLLLEVSFRLGRRCRPRMPVMVFFAAWCLFAGLAAYVPPLSLCHLWAWELLHKSAFCVVPLAYFLLTPGRDGGIVARYAFLLQNFNPGRASYSYVRVASGFLPQKALRQAPGTVLLKGLKLLIWARLLGFLFQEGNYLLYGRSGESLPPLFRRWSLNWADPAWIGLNQYNGLHVSRWQAWVAVFWFAISFIGNLSVYSNLIIAVFRLGGIYLPRSVCRPLRAQSFNECFRRIMYFYSEAIVNLCFYPLYRASFRLPWGRTTRRLVALFAAVFFGGFILHLLGRSMYFAFYGEAETFRYFSRCLPYFVVLSAACCLSEIGLVPGPARLTLPRWACAGIFFGCYALMLQLYPRYPSESWHDRAAFLSALFGISS
jgi:hypothetical protein